MSNRARFCSRRWASVLAQLSYLDDECLLIEFGKKIDKTTHFKYVKPQSWKVLISRSSLPYDLRVQSLRDHHPRM